MVRPPYLESKSTQTPAVPLLQAPVPAQHSAWQRQQHLQVRTLPLMRMPLLTALSGVALRAVLQGGYCYVCTSPARRKSGYCCPVLSAIVLFGVTSFHSTPLFSCWMYTYSPKACRTPTSRYAISSAAQIALLAVCTQSFSSWFRLLLLQHTRHTTAADPKHLYCADQLPNQCLCLVCWWQCRTKVWERSGRQEIEDFVVQGRQMEDRSCQDLPWRILQT